LVVLEVGAGIGTLTYTTIFVLQKCSPKFRLISIEDNEWCLSQLKANLGELYNKVEIISNCDELPKGLQFDFVIIDGGGT